MSMIRTAKLFKNGASQAIRLPAEFRFEGAEVYISRDDATGNVVLSSKPVTKAWDDFFDFVHRADIDGDFMSERPLNTSPQERNLFEDEA